MTNDDYLAAVAAELDDLPDDDLTDLLADVEAHLADVTAEFGTPAETHLGPPAEYAAELRSAAGLPPRAPSQRLPRLRAAGRRIAHQRAVREVRAFLPELRPAWWVARAALVVAVISALTDESFPRLGGSALAGLLAVAAGVVVSVKVGRRSYARAGRFAVAGLNLLAVAAAGLLWVGPGNQAAPYVYTTVVTEDGLRAPDGQPITNIFPYDSHGKPLKDVELRDQWGNSIGDMVCPLTCRLSGQPRTFPLPAGPVPSVVWGNGDVAPFPLVPQPTPKAAPRP